MDSNPNRLWKVWLVSGTAVIGFDFLLSVPDETRQIVGVGDFNGDGGADILWRDRVGGPT